MREKPRLSFGQIWNMSFGFLGIQFGWGLQLANMSAIYTYLGAKESDIPLLWLAGPVTGLAVQPIIGAMSDRTWNWLGRRRPYFRGATLANALPYIFRYFGVEGRTPSGIPLTVQYSFKLGAAAFILAVLWTVFTSKEYPPEDIEAFERMRAEQRGFIATITALLREIASAIAEMPATMRQLAVVQFFTWLGLFCMWLFFGLMTSYHVFGATSDKDRLFPLGGEWGGICFMVYSVVTFVVAFLLPGFARKTSRKTVYAISLVCGGVGLLLTYFIQDKYALLLTMVGVGIAWASILSMPYAILSGALPPARMGIYMGVFNFFIVLPEITQALTFGPIIRAVFGAENHNAPLYMVMTGGVFLLLAAALVSRVEDVSGDVRERAVIRGDEEEPVLVQHSVQPVPSTGLLDDEGKRRRD